MPTNDLSEAKYLLRRALSKDADLVLDHPWVWEVERWKELVFALLSRVVSLPEHEARALVNELEDLELLDVRALAELHSSGNIHGKASLDARRILQLLNEKGVNEADAQRGLTTICEAALGLEKHYSGKVQRYLRHYGEQMIRDVDQVFRFSALDEAEVKKAFTYWLQNVLNMPLSLADQFVEAFCKKNHLPMEQVFAAADELNMNVALVDDLLQRIVEVEGGSAPQAVQAAKKQSASEGGARNVPRS